MASNVDSSPRGQQKRIRSVYDSLKTNLPEEEFSQVRDLLYGGQIP